MTVGTHGISANFGGDGTYGPAQRDDGRGGRPGATTTTITYPAAGTSLDYGNENQNPFNVTVSAAPGRQPAPSGNVTFYSGAPGPDTYLCSTGLGGFGNGQSNGNCYLNSVPMDAGTYQLTAVYSGDAEFAGSTAVQALTINQVQTQMNVFAVPGTPSTAPRTATSSSSAAAGATAATRPGTSTSSPTTGPGRPTACSAGNGGGNPCYIDSATALPASTTPYTVTVSYPGDVNFTSASDSVSLMVFPATTTTTLAVTPSTVHVRPRGPGARSR